MPLTTQWCVFLRAMGTPGTGGAPPTARLRFTRQAELCPGRTACVIIVPSKQSPCAHLPLNLTQESCLPRLIPTCCWTATSTEICPSNACPPSHLKTGSLDSLTQNLTTSLRACKQTDHLKTNMCTLGQSRDSTYFFLEKYNMNIFGRLVKRQAFWLSHIEHLGWISAEKHQKAHTDLRGQL